MVLFIDLERLPRIPEQPLSPPEPRYHWNRCDECRRSEEDCGELIRWEDASTDICQSCLNEKTAICKKCGGREWIEWMKDGVCSDCQRNRKGVSA